MNENAFKNKVWLATPTMHGDDELKYIKEAFDANWLTTLGANIDAIEQDFAQMLGRKYAVALQTCTAAIHMALKIASIKVYGKPENGILTLAGKEVISSDLTYCATTNPIVYEGGSPVLVDSEYKTWNMCPEALEKAFELHPDVKIVVLAHLYGTPSQIDEVKAVCDKHGAIIVEDAAESFGATYKGKQTGTFGDVSCISFNGNKIITGSSGGMFLTDNKEEAETVRNWAAQAREDAPWFLHANLGYNYAMSNVVAGIVRGQLPHLQEHIDAKIAIHKRYEEVLKDVPVTFNAYDPKNSVPNYWLSCLLVEPNYMCKQIRHTHYAEYTEESGKSCPTQILEAISNFNAEGRPLWNPMHNHPYYQNKPYVTKDGDARAQGYTGIDVSMDLFDRGLCLPSDIKMTPQEQDVIIEAIKKCFK